MDSQFFGETFLVFDFIFALPIYLVQSNCSDNGKFIFYPNLYVRYCSVFFHIISMKNFC